MGELSGEGRKSDVLGIGLALDAYRTYTLVESIPHMSDDKLKEYEAIRVSLSPEDKSKLDDKIIELRRPDLAPAPSSVQQEISTGEIADIISDNSEA